MENRHYSGRSFLEGISGFDPNPSQPSLIREGATVPRHPEFISASHSLDINPDLHNSYAQQTVKDLSPLTSHFSRKRTAFTLAEDFHPAERFRKIAFTLAEVLITLGIIGVIAALTMPVLMANYQKQKTVTQLKKAYSEISQALKLAEVEYGTITNWELGTAYDGDSAVNFANKYLIPYMNVVKNCGKETGCLNGEIYSLSGRQYTFYASDSGRFATFNVNSGYTVLVISGGTYANVGIILDHKKDKLVMGKDVFYFQMNSRLPGRLLYAHGLYAPDSEGNISIRNRDEIRDTEQYGCNKSEDSQTIGMNCSGLIVADNWQISSDYPW